jgi:hypothetical protein
MGHVTLTFFFILRLVMLWLGCIPKISFYGCLKVPQNWVVVEVVVVESEFSDRLWLSFSNPWPS